MMPSLRITLCLFLLLLCAACQRGDRGGVHVDPTNFKASSSSAKAPPTPVFIVSSAGKCLEMAPLDYLAVTTEATVHSWDCMADAPYQQWLFSQEDEIVSTNGLCLSLGEAVDQGVAVLATACDGSETQKWHYDELTSALVNATEPNQCLDIWNNDLAANGKSIQLWNCTAYVNQRWTITALDYRFIRNTLNTNTFINIEPKDVGPDLAATPILSGWLSAQWLIEPSDGSVRIRNHWRPEQFLHIENGFLESNTIDPTWLSSRWVLLPQAGGNDQTFLIRSFWRPHIYLGLDAENHLKAAEISALLDGSTLWDIRSNFSAD